MVKPKIDSVGNGFVRPALWLAAVLWAALAAGCGTPKPAPDAADAAASQPAPMVAAPPVAAAPEASTAPAGPAAQQQAQKLAQSTVDLLEGGNEEQARAELQRALALDPANKLAMNLNRQMTDDPVTTLGKESFPYVVRAGDTLSRIAGRFLGDIYAFHILARYNNIKVPRQVGEGQTIRVPGKAPPATASPTRDAAVKPDARKPAKPAAEPEPAVATAVPAAEPQVSPADAAYKSADAAAKAGSLDKAWAEYKRAAGLGHPTAGVQAEATAKRLIDNHSRNARAALARQDLDGAIRSWDRVLEIDPQNETARLERQKALRLKDKVKAL